MLKRQNVLISEWKRCFVKACAPCPNLFKGVYPLRKWQKVARSVRKWQHVHISYSKRCFGKTRENRKKVVRQVQKRQNWLISDWKRLFCTNSCTLLETAKKWCAQGLNAKTSWSRAQNAAQTRSLWLTNGSQVRKWQNRLISGWIRYFVQTHPVC